jgi:hypothetical protein
MLCSVPSTPSSADRLPAAAAVEGCVCCPHCPLSLSLCKLLVPLPPTGGSGTHLLWFDLAAAAAATAAVVFLPLNYTAALLCIYIINDSDINNK